MSVSVRPFGSHDGKRVDQFHLISETGVEVDILSYGVVVRDWRVPVKTGLRQVVLGFDSFDAYPVHSPYFGCVVGRVANRIGGAQFRLEGVTYRVPANDGANGLHGGPQGLCRQIWDGEIDNAGNAVRFTHFSPDGAMGYPGNVHFSALYALTGKRLRLELSAMPDRKTPISLVQHNYFNLGTGPDVLEHSFQFAADTYTETDAQLVPTGRVLPVDGTRFDFRQARTLRDAGGVPLAYDINLALTAGRNPAAIVVGPDAALTLKLWTDRPGLQFYNGAYTNVPVAGLNGRRYGQFSGFCVEDQAFPDAVNQPGFGSVIFSSERAYRHWCEIEVGSSEIGSD